MYLFIYLFLNFIVAFVLVLSYVNFGIRARCSTSPISKLCLSFLFNFFFYSFVAGNFVKGTAMTKRDQLYVQSEDLGQVFFSCDRFHDEFLCGFYETSTGSF